MLTWPRLGMFAALTSIGCMHTAYSTGHPRAQHKPTVQGTHHFFIAGLANSADLDASSICSGRPVSRVETNKSFLNGFLSAITSGIYTPRSYRVWCGKVGREPASLPMPIEHTGHREQR